MKCTGWVFAVAIGLALPSGAFGEDKHHCKNADAEYVDLGDGAYRCVHKSKYYEQECDSGYTYSDGKCVDTDTVKVNTPDCDVFQYKQVRSGTDKCWASDKLKTFKRYVKCASNTLDVDYGGGQTDYCVKKKTTTKSLDVTACPLGWEKGDVKKDYGNGHVVRYCETAL